MTHPIGRFDVVLERGPDWLFVRLEASEGGHRGRGHDLATSLWMSLWELARDHGTRRVVVELDALGGIDDDLLDELEMLGRILERENGVLRLCGASAIIARHESCGAAGHLPHFSCRSEAVRAGSWECACPSKPR